jgi:hypothetical protein
VASIDLGPGGWDDMSAILPTSAVGVLVYGSRARGDHTGASDLDVLAIIGTPRDPAIRGRVSLSFYTPDQLRDASGTLFGSHLAQDAVIVHDTANWTRCTLETLRIADAPLVLQRIGHFAVILDVAAREDPTAHLGGRIRLARYLLRSALYARSIDDGSPCFSVRQLADATGTPALVRLLAADAPPTGADGRRVLRELESSLREIVDLPSTEPRYQSLAELVLSEWERDHERAALAALVLGDDIDAFDYAQLPRIAL